LCAEGMQISSEVAGSSWQRFVRSVGSIPVLV
jgi:hypothetical protein